MSTFADLIDSITSSLHSYTGVQERVTWLTEAVDASQTTLAVASSETVMRGIAEIEEELIYVDSSDSGGLNLAPFGRGYRGSAAASHALNTQVTYDPMFPRKEVHRAVEQCLAGLYPNLFQVKTTDLTYEVMPVGYELPADCGFVLEVTAQRPGDPYDYWMPVQGYSFDGGSPETSGKALNLFDTLVPGSTIRVTYAAAFGAFTDTSDTLDSAGVPESYADLILYCVSSRMVRFLDPVRLQVSSTENLSRSQVVQAGDAGKIANQLYAMYQQRVIEERRKLLNLTTIRPNSQR